jgi:hypothetical protein
VPGDSVAVPPLAGGMTAGSQALHPDGSVRLLVAYDAAALGHRLLPWLWQGPWCSPPMAWSFITGPAHE